MRLVVAAALILAVGCSKQVPATLQNEWAKVDRLALQEQRPTLEDLKTELGEPIAKNRDGQTFYSWYEFDALNDNDVSCSMPMLTASFGQDGKLGLYVRVKPLIANSVLHWRIFDAGFLLLGKWESLYRVKDGHFEDIPVKHQ